MCGKQTSWLSRIKYQRLEFCGSVCSKKWQAGRQAEADRREAEARLVAEEQLHLVRSQAAVRAAATRAKSAAAKAEAKRKAEEKWKQASADLRRKIRSEPNNPLPHVELARLASGHDRLKLSKDHYLTAIAIGFADAWEEATAQWELAGILWLEAKSKSSSGMWIFTWRDLDTAADYYSTAAYPAESAFPDVSHYVTLAGKSLQSYLRWNPDDLDALKLQRKVIRVLGQSDAAIKQQIEIASRRRRIRGTKSTRKGDKTGLGFETRCLALIRSLGWRADVTRASGDGGIDIMAHSDDPFTGGKLVIQCKDWSAAVGEPPVRDLPVRCV